MINQLQEGKVRPHKGPVWLQAIFYCSKVGTQAQRIQSAKELAHLSKRLVKHRKTMTQTWHLHARKKSIQLSRTSAIPYTMPNDIHTIVFMHFYLMLLTQKSLDLSISFS